MHTAIKSFEAFPSHSGADSIRNDLLLLIPLLDRPIVTIDTSSHFQRSPITDMKITLCTYSNSLATFHCVLEGDLIFKLNSGPTHNQSNLAIRTHCSSTRRASQSTRTRILSILSSTSTEFRRLNNTTVLFRLRTSLSSLLRLLRTQRSEYSWCRCPGNGILCRISDHETIGTCYL